MHISSPSAVRMIKRSETYILLVVVVDAQDQDEKRAPDCRLNPLKGKSVFFFFPEGWSVL
jgi:hypothetical protein